MGDIITEPTKNGGKTSRLRTAVIVCIVVTLVAGMAIAGYFVWDSARRRTALADCQSSTARVKEEKKKLEAQLSETAETAKIRSEQVVDSQTVTTLETSLSEASSRNTGATRCDAGASFDDLRSSASANSKLAASLKASTGTVKAAAENVSASKAAKELADAKTTLDNKLKDARSLLASSDGRVADNQTRETLTTAIDDAAKAGTSTAAYSDALSTLVKAMETVDNTVDAKTKADEAAAKASATTKQSSGSSSSTGVANSYGQGQSSSSPSGSGSSTVKNNSGGSKSQGNNSGNGTNSGDDEWIGCTVSPENPSCETGWL